MEQDLHLLHLTKLGTHLRQKGLLDVVIETSKSHLLKWDGPHIVLIQLWCKEETDDVSVKCKTQKNRQARQKGGLIMAKTANETNDTEQKWDTHELTTPSCSRIKWKMTRHHIRDSCISKCYKDVTGRSHV